MEELLSSLKDSCISDIQSCSLSILKYLHCISDLNPCWYDLFYGQYCRHCLVLYLEGHLGSACSELTWNALSIFLVDFLLLSKFSYLSLIGCQSVDNTATEISSVLLLPLHMHVSSWWTLVYHLCLFAFSFLIQC